MPGCRLTGRRRFLARTLILLWFPTGGQRQVVSRFNRCATSVATRLVLPPHVRPRGGECFLGGRPGLTTEGPAHTQNDHLSLVLALFERIVQVDRQITLADREKPNAEMTTLNSIRRGC